MTFSYFLFLGIGAVICTGLFAWKLDRQNLSPALAPVALVLALVLGTLLSKVLYVLLLFPSLFDNYGIAALWRTEPTEFSFFGGCAGVCLAVLLAAKWLHQPTTKTLDAFAPCGALMVAFARAGVAFMAPNQVLGLGAFVENESLWFFPVARESFGMWFFAIFMLEAVFALVCAAVSFLLSARPARHPGHPFLHTVFFLALPQIFCEQLLNSYMQWGFIRIEQLLCGLVVLGIILYACVRHGNGFASFVPAVLTVVCMLGLIDLEFMLDNKYLFGLELGPITCYLLMLVLLGVMAWLFLWAFRRMNKKSSSLS